MKRIKYLDEVAGYIYFRRHGKRWGVLPQPKGSPEFWSVYNKFLAETERTPAPPAARAARAATAIGSVEWVIQKFLASEYFVSMHDKRPLFTAGTQANYRPVLERMCRETIKGMTAPIGTIKLAAITPKFAQAYLHKVKTACKPTVARTQLMLLSNLWKFAMRLDEFDPGAQTNPFAGIGESTFYQVEQEHEPWPEEVQDRFTAACDKNLYLAFHLLLWTGQRIGDVVRLKWSQWDGTRLTLIQQKTKEPVRVKPPKILRDMLNKVERVHDNILTHKWGRPYTRDSLHHRIKEVLISNGDGDYTPHGLRKNAGIMLAENGGEVPMIMAQLGHRTPKLALYYCRLARHSKLTDAASTILDMVADERAALKGAKVAARRAQIREVK